MRRAQALERARGNWSGRLAAGARGALLAGLVFSLAGAVPGAGIDRRLWLAVLGALLGLVEAQARRQSPQAASTPDAVERNRQP